MPHCFEFGRCYRQKRNVGIVVLLVHTILPFLFHKGMCALSQQGKQFYISKIFKKSLSLGGCPISAESPVSPSFTSLFSP